VRGHFFRVSPCDQMPGRRLSAGLRGTACRSSTARRSMAAAALFAIALGSMSPAAGLPPSETIFPTTTRAWLSIPDTKAFQERFDRSPYGQFLADPAMKEFVDGLRERISQNGRQRLQKLGLTLEDLEKIPGGEVAAAAIESRPGTLATVLLVDTTGKEAEAKALVDRITKRLLERKATTVSIPGAPPQLTVYQLPDDLSDDRVPKGRRVAFALAPSALVVGDDAQQVGQAFAVLGQGREDSLATVQSFKAVVPPCAAALPEKTAPMRWFVDPLAFAKAYQASNPPREKRKGPDYVAILGRQGFDAVKGAGGVIAFGVGSHAFRHHTMVYAPPLPGREPLAADTYDLAARMLRFPNVDRMQPPAWVPRDVTGWTTLEWDLRQAFGAAETLVDDIVGDKGVYDDVIASLKEDPDGPQIDVEQDLVACLGTRLTMVSDHVDPLGPDCERLVIAVEATDEAKVAATIAKVMNADKDMQKLEIGGHQVWELIDRSAALPQLEIETPGGAITHADHDDESQRRRQRIRDKEEKLLPHSAVTVANGHLLIASHRDVLEKVLLAPAGEQLSATADTTATLAELDRLVSSQTALRSFGREDETVRPAYELLRQGSMPKSKSIVGQILNGVLGDGKPGTVREQRIDGSSLPEFEKVRRYLGTAALGMESRPDGWYITGLALPRATDAGMARKPETAVGR
jgi:hypothetical protein